MAELADAQDLGSCGAIHAGSTPVTRTKFKSDQSLYLKGFIAFFFFVVLQ